MSLNKKQFKASELKVIGRANPDDVAYVVDGATVWLRSGSPPLKVVSVNGRVAITEWMDGESNRTDNFPVECLTPEPTPVSSG